MTWAKQVVGLVTLIVALGAAGARAQEEEEADPAEVAIGERLFLETRFAQFFAAHAGGNVNAPLAAGDPVVATTDTLQGPIPNPFAGQAMNCRSCHFVDDQKATPGGGSKAYNDFARRSPIPAREDGATTTPRNSPALVGSALSRTRPFLLHFDGEFPSSAALVRGTFLGRNFGWLHDEQALAVAHIARVIREDDGSGALAQQAGGSYRAVLAADPSVPAELRLPKRFRLDVTRATEPEILDAVAKLVAAYVDSLDFARDETNANAGSPYDLFLQMNGIPRKTLGSESSADYLRRFRASLAAVASPAFVTPADGTFALHTHPFQFGATELEGLRIFFSPTRGNCVACHLPPAFTDFSLHNTGVSQRDYDAVHGPGAFAALAIPDEAQRAASPDTFLPGSPAHPHALEPFRALVTIGGVGRGDLGVWNVFRNPDMAARRHERGLRRLVCRAAAIPAATCGRRVTLDDAIGLFKTPTLRDLGHTAPYFHAGTDDDLESVIRFYADASQAVRAGTLRNGAFELSTIQLTEADVVPLAAFLRALDEDYE